MYKKQLVFQKYACLFAVIAAAVSFVYSLGIITDIYDTLYSTMMNPADLTQTFVPGSIIYYDMQEFNRELTTAGIVLILLAVSQFIFQNQNRRKYYIANYITVGANALGAIYYSYWALNNIFLYKERYLKIDFAELSKLNARYGFKYTESTFWFDAGKYVFGFLLAATAINVLNMVWKICLMKGEKKLVQAGKEGKAA